MAFALRLGLFVFTALVALPACAAAPQFLGSHRDWNVYAVDDADRRICYIASEPKEQDGDYSSRGAPAVLVTRRPGPASTVEVSVQPGYPYLDGSGVDVRVGDDTFNLFTQGEHAWTRTAEDDKALIEAMKRGINMTVRGTSTKRTYSLDTYSLLGFTNAYNAMLQACQDN